MFEKPIEAELYSVQKGTVKNYVSEEGEANSKNKSTVYSEMTAIVKEAYFEVGDNVNKGDILVVFDKTDMELNMQKLNQKISDLKSSKDYAQIEKAQANLNEAIRKLNNAKKLLEKGAITQEEYTELEYSKNVLSYELETAKKNQITLQSQINELEYEIEMLKNDEQKMELTSYIDGIITEKFISDNTPVSYKEQLYEIIDTQGIFVESDILASEVVNVELEDEVEILNPDTGLILYGKVSKINPKAFNKVNDLGVEQKRVKVEISVLSGKQHLRLGYKYDLKILTEELEDKIIVPETTVFDKNEKNYVFTVKNDIAELREVKVIFYGEDFIGVEGLEEGENVVLSPDEKIEAGIKVVRDETNKSVQIK
jgi:HlyD family secretion protein